MTPLIADLTAYTMLFAFINMIIDVDFEENLFYTLRYISIMILLSEYFINRNVDSFKCVFDIIISCKISIFYMYMFRLIVPDGFMFPYLNVFSMYIFLGLIIYFDIIRLNLIFMDNDFNQRLFNEDYFHVRFISIMIFSICVCYSCFETLKVLPRLLKETYKIVFLD